MSLKGVRTRWHPGHPKICVSNTFQLEGFCHPLGFLGHYFFFIVLRSFLFAWTNKVSPFEQLFTLRGHQKKKAVMMMLHIQGATPKNDELARIELPNFTVYKESFLMFRPASIKTDY